MALFDSITPKTFQITLMVVFVLLIAGLTSYQLRFYIQGPKIIIDQLYLQSDGPYQDVSFVVRNANSVFIADRMVVPQVSGL